MKDFKLIEHNLIPAALFVLNISIVHLIYLLFVEETSSIITFLVMTSIALIIMGVVRKIKYMIAAASAIYMLILILLF